MAAELHIHSETPPLAWEEFKATRPMGSIALDGYVTGPPNYEPVGPYANFNHHEGVDRLATLSTAQQIVQAIRMGMTRPFEKDGVFAAHAYVNDCDEDVCAAWYVLKHVEQTKSVTNPALNRFIGVAGTLDVTAGAFPYDKDLKLLGQLDWIFEPYHLFRASGEMAKKDNGQYRSVITSVSHRIQQHLLGNGESVALDTRYKRIGGGKDWAMIEPIGKNAAVGAFRDGIDAFITVQQAGDTTWRYGIRRRSKFIPFDNTAIYAELNNLEGCTDDLWGGADNAGGSPRVAGSKLTPSTVEAAINQKLAAC